MKKRLISGFIFILTFVCIDQFVGYILNKGLNNYFGLSQHSSVLLIGHSHLMLAVDKEKLESGLDRKISKYCREGVNVADRHIMIKQFLESPYSDSLQYVIYGVDQFMFTGAGLSQNSYKLFYPFMENQIMNQYIKKQDESTYDYLLHKTIHSTRYSDALINSAIRGWRNDWSNYKVGQLDISQLENQVAVGKQRKIYFEQELIDIFEETLVLLTSKNIHVIMINTPIAQPLNNYEPEVYQRFISYMQDIPRNNKLIEYWDYNPVYSNRYELFFDPIHLNPLGQQTITRQIIQDFKSKY